MIDDFFKSVIDMDRAPIVICDTDHIILYMNPSAVRRYMKSGGEKLVGTSVLECHNERSKVIITTQRISPASAGGGFYLSAQSEYNLRLNGSDSTNRLCLLKAEL